MKNKLFDTIFEELVKTHGITKMTKVLAITATSAIGCGGLGYLTAMHLIPDDTSIVEKLEKENI